jgi:diadenosine tetraphosphatase ApaH/serine/threonine PP2A family protein phosphatase
VAWTLEHTDERSKRFTCELPFDLRFELAGKRVRLVHGSPRKVNECLLEDRAASTFERMPSSPTATFSCSGTRTSPGSASTAACFVNCGSVGKPKDRDRRGSFTVVTESDGGVSVSIERVEYDASAVTREIRNDGLPPELAEQLEQAA